MKRTLKAVTLSALLAASFQAAATHEVNGIIVDRIDVDPTDVVVLTNTGNGCGSQFFHLPRTNQNFKEMYALLFLAFKNQVPINFAVQDTCQGDRSFISHGSMGNG